MSLRNLHKRVNLNNLTATDKIKLTKSTYAKDSYFQHLFNKDHIELECEKFSLSFRNEIERILIEKNIINDQVPLEKLHEVLSEEMKEYNFDDGVNKISTYFYETDHFFTKTYHQFIRFLRTNFIKEPFWFQAIPTIRIHCPNGKNNNHYPRYHTDIGYGHPPEEINIWIPLTDILTGHGFRVSSVASSKKILEKFNYDFSQFIHAAIHVKETSTYCDSLSSAATTPFKKMLAFDSRCIHTGEPLTSHTRASIDIRILPTSQYEKMDIEYQGSGRRKIIFAPGHCYYEKDSEYLLNDERI